MKSVNLANRDIFFYDRMLMQSPQGGALVRQCVFMLPALLQPGPVLQVTIERQGGVGWGTYFGVYDIDVVQNGPQTEIKITAQSSTALPVQGDYYCNLNVIGTPLTKPAQ
jgi:hypothetical protein